MRKSIFILLLVSLTAFGASKNLDIYIVDVEGGNATLFVSPTGESLLIDTGNVGQLRKAWEYHTGDGDSMSQIQVNALETGGVLYGVSPRLKLFALEAATGKPRWVFDPARPGVDHHVDPGESAQGLGRGGHRIHELGTAGPDLGPRGRSA